MSDFCDEFDSFIAVSDGLESAPVSESLLKRKAALNFDKHLEREGICLLSEAHGLSLRKECSYQQRISRSYGKEGGLGLKNQYVGFSCYENDHEKQYEKLLKCLRELPEEWTIVQLTRPFDPKERWTPREAERPPSRSKLHLVRYNCGPALREPFHVMIKEPRGTYDNTESIFDIIYNATGRHPKKDNITKYQRGESNEKMKAAVQEVSSGWLRHWSCLLLGHLCDKQIELIIKTSTKKIFKEYFEVAGISDSNKQQILYQIISGSAYLTETCIKQAVSELVSDVLLSDEIAHEIILLKEKHSWMLSAMRYPVILILDEKLECIPWEMTTVLRNHPVCRMPSIHFIYALYKEHENSIKGVNKMITDEESGYYIVNPDESLTVTQDRIMTFVKARFPKWTGLAGIAPSAQEFTDALENNSFVLYCGHGNGTQYLHSNTIAGLDVQALPFLFGCSSVKPIDLGGRVSFSGLSQKYLMARCACVVGMMWSVTNNDTDQMTLSLLNNFLSGEKVKLTGFIGTKNGEAQEPELLRALVKARDSANMYTNKAALVAYGIPIAVKGSKI